MSTTNEFAKNTKPPAPVAESNGDTPYNTTAEWICSQLGGRKISSGYVARCPAHADEHASLSISEGTDIPLVHCHAGCSQGEVIDALKARGGWAYSGNSETKIVAAYDYRNEAGDLLYQKVRFDPKRFAQRRPDGEGGWIWNLKDVEPLPYRLPELTSAIQNGDAIFIAEGEKDCDALWELGLPATTNSGGAGKWSEALTRHLAGAKEIIILPDNDDPGMKHAREVATSGAQAGIPVKVVPLPGVPHKGDVTDWLSSGGTRDALIKLASNTAPFDHGTIAPAAGSLIDWADPSSFGAPLMFGASSLPQIRSDFLPPWVRQYVDALSESTQTPQAMASMLVLAVIAACVQKRYKVSPDSEYEEPLSLWVLVAMPPASRKTAVLKALTAPVEEWEREQELVQRQLIAEHQMQRDISEKRIEELKRQASKAEQ